MAYTSAVHPLWPVLLPDAALSYCSQQWRIMTTPEDSFHLCPTLSHCLCVAITWCSHLISLSGYLSLSPRKHRLTHTHSWAGGGTWAVKLFKLLAESVAIAGRKWGSIHKCLFIDFTRPVQRPWLRSFPVHSLSVNGKTFHWGASSKKPWPCVSVCWNVLHVHDSRPQGLAQIHSAVFGKLLCMFLYLFGVLIKNQLAINHQERTNFLSCSSMKGE